MIRVQTKIIGDHTYKVQQLGAKEGRHCLVRLGKTLGPMLAALMEDVNVGKGKTLSVMDMNIQSLAKAMDRLAENIHAEDLDYFCETFGSRTMLVDGSKEVVLDLAKQEMFFAGRYKEMFQWLAFCVEVNYSDFFGLIQSTSGGSPPAAGKDSSP